MIVDREQIRRVLEAWKVEITTPGNAGTEAWHTLQDVVFGDGPELLLALLAELEQAEKERTGVSVIEFETMRFRAERAEARLAKAPALVEALRYCARPGAADSATALAVLAEWERE